MADGKVVQVIGPVVDVQFPGDSLPELLNAVRIRRDGESDLTVEVAQMLGDDVVRCVAMASTDGLVRGMSAEDTGAPIRVPVGPETLGRVWNLLGKPIDEKGDVEFKEHNPIHRTPPAFEEQTLRERRQGRPLRRCRAGQDGPHPGAHPQYRHGARRRFGVRRSRRAHP